MKIDRREVKARLYACMNCLANKERVMQFTSDARRPKCPQCHSYKIKLAKEIILNERGERMTEEKPAEAPAAAPKPAEEKKPAGKKKAAPPAEVPEAKDERGFIDEILDI